MTSKLFFSVIIPTYNAEHFIRRTLDSVKIQTFKDYEVIIVDDCSNDRTVEICLELKKDFNQDFEIIHCEENHGGPATPKNIGIKRAKGEFIAFLDQDDVWLPNKLEENYELIKKNNDVSAIFSNALIMSGEKILAKDYWQIYLENNHLPNQFEGIKNMLGKNEKTPVLTSSTAVIKHEVFKKIGYFDEQFKIYDDNDFWSRIKENGLTYLLIEKPLVVWVFHKNNLSRSGNLSLVKELYLFFQKRDLKNNSNEKEIVYKKQKYHIRFANDLMIRGNYAEAEEIYQENSNYLKEHNLKIILLLCKVMPSFLRILLYLKRIISEKFSQKNFIEQAVKDLT